MKDAKRLDPPEHSAGDTAHLVANELLSIIPGAAGLFQRFVTPPLEKRQNAWMQEVATAIKRLEQNIGLTTEELAENEAFASVVLQATYVAIRNHHEEKKRALTNCIFNAGTTSTIAIDLQLNFVRYIDELSPFHIQLLRAIKERSAEIASLRSYETFYKLIYQNSTNPPTRDVFKMMCLELQGRGLIRISQDIEDFEGVFEASLWLREDTIDDLPRVMISEVGIQFLEFISSSDSPS